MYTPCAASTRSPLPLVALMTVHLHDRHRPPSRAKTRRRSSGAHTSPVRPPNSISSSAHVALVLLQAVGHRHMKFEALKHIPKTIG
ncbi:hypothetical protein BV25DRAFT_1820829 [Artomyces pyxidatus]|uniref:Uncharacterized protein n=1 Tax=Artomyces pyxidatus TaxID=48021 RepID=A0ACB8TEA3_9AGAM|nr:hypothetical protein BV25DRAFT_1820829 [Artomyces pyxidatus]